MIERAERSPEELKVGPDEQMIVDRIYAAVMEQRLAPKTKLSEAALCEAFGVGRMRVRRALLLLSSQGIVDLQSNRGAFVECPSPREAREVFDARLMIESGIVRELAAGIAEESERSLRRHIMLEDAARRDGKRTDLIRISGEFHVELARCHGNSVLTRTVRELVTRTSLIVAMFGVSRRSTCPGGEHGEIIEAMAARESDRAVELIRNHLLRIEEGLELDRAQTEETDVASILRGG